MKKFTLPVVVLLLLASCGPKLPYSADIPMGRSTFTTRDGNLSGLVPAGWFASPTDSIAQSLAAWCVREDYAAVLTIREILFDETAARRVAAEGLPLVARFNALADGNTDAAAKVNNFDLGTLQCSSYETSVEGKPARVVVFSRNGRYYACTARGVTGTWPDPDVLLLFRTQQSFLNAIR